ncbi:hypothetical protein [Phormidesmis priestleyi]
MSESFNPIKGKAGEFRVALNLTELDDRAWEILTFSQQLGFNAPQFQTRTRHSGAVEVWAIILQQFHQYETDTRHIVDVWDNQIDELRRAIGADDEFNLVMLCNFANYLEGVV